MNIRPDDTPLAYPPELAKTFVLTCRILLNEGVSEAAFNVSCRLSDRLLLTMPVTSPSLVREENLLVNEISAYDGPWKAHNAIYEARPDVGAIVHVHPPYAVAFGSLMEEFRPIHHYGAPFHGKLPNYDRPGQTGGKEEAKRLAQALGDAPGMLQQGHGSITVGQDLREAMLLTLYLEEACRIYSIARNMGTPRPLTVEQSETITRQIMKPRSQAKAWDHYCDKLRWNGRT